MCDLMYLSHGGISYDKALDIPIDEVHSLHKNLVENKKAELELLSPAHLLALMFGSKQ